jgi:hypothetical protein
VNTTSHQQVVERQVYMVWNFSLAAINNSQPLSSRRKETCPTQAGICQLLAGALFSIADDTANF